MAASARASRLTTRLLTRSVSSSSVTTTATKPVVWTYLKNLVSYSDAYRFQNSLVQHKINNPSSSLDWLILLEHHPVYTAGRRQSGEDIEREKNRLASLNPNAQFVQTLRGGQLTFHGPGQLVGYPILNLKMMNLTARMYVDLLMNLMRSLLVHPILPHPIESLDPADNPDMPVGIFIGDSSVKIGSIGVQIRKRIACHGFALNVAQESELGFKSIVACGLKNTTLTSIQSVLKANHPLDPTINLADLIHPTVDIFGKLTGCVMKEMDPTSQELDPIGYQLVREFIDSQQNPSKKDHQLQP